MDCWRDIFHVNVWHLLMFKPNPLLFSYSRVCITNRIVEHIELFPLQPCLLTPARFRVTISSFPSLQEAIASHLELLYETPISPLVPGGPRHLIDHELHMRKLVYDEDQNNKPIQIPSKSGIYAYICCPKIISTLTRNLVLI